MPWRIDMQPRARGELIETRTKRGTPARARDMKFDQPASQPPVSGFLHDVSTVSIMHRDALHSVRVPHRAGGARQGGYIEGVGIGNFGRNAYTRWWIFISTHRIEPPGTGPVKWNNLSRLNVRARLNEGNIISDTRFNETCTRNGTVQKRNFGVQMQLGREWGRIIEPSFVF